MTCPTCNGRRKVTKKFWFFTYDRDCSECDGKGWVASREVRHTAKPAPPIMQRPPGLTARPAAPPRATAAERDDDRLSSMMLVGESDHVAAATRAMEPAHDDNRPLAGGGRFGGAGASHSFADPAPPAAEHHDAGDHDSHDSDSASSSDSGGDGGGDGGGD